MRETSGKSVISEPASKPPIPDRLVVIEYLRGFAALSVAWFHLTNTYSNGWVRASGSLGWLGVEVFFVISGFVIPMAISKTWINYSLKDFPAFMIRRLVRLEPPYLISIALAVVLWHASALAPDFQGRSPDYTIWQLTAHFFYFIPMTDFNWLQPVYWSLAWEFAFYITLGLVFSLVDPSRPPTAYYGLCTIMILLVTGEVFPARVLLFLIGISLFRIISRNRYATPIGDLVIGFLSVTLIAIFNLKIATVGVCTALLIYALRDRRLQGVVGDCLIGLGTISYSLYLIHVPIGGRIVNLGQRFGDGQIFDFTLSVIALIFCIALSVGFWRAFERPFVELGKKQAKTFDMSRRMSSIRNK